MCTPCPPRAPASLWVLGCVGLSWVVVLLFFDHVVSCSILFPWLCRDAFPKTAIPSPGPDGGLSPSPSAHHVTLPCPSPGPQGEASAPQRAFQPRFHPCLRLPGFEDFAAFAQTCQMVLAAQARRTSLFPVPELPAELPVLHGTPPPGSPP